MSRLTILTSLTLASLLALAGMEALANQKAPGFGPMRAAKLAPLKKAKAERRKAPARQGQIGILRAGPAAAQGAFPQGPTTIGTPFAANCAAGFQMVDKQEGQVSGANWVDEFSCATPVIQCPAQTQGNGLKSSVTPKASIVQIGGDPDGGKKTFRVVYECDYGWTATPEG